MNVNVVSDLELEKAAATGDLDVLRSVDVTRLRRFKHSRWSKVGLLDVAIEHQQVGVVTWLVQTSLESGVDLGGWTVGHAASFAGDLEVLTGLSEEELQARSDSGSTLVHAAALGGRVDIIERLVELGVDPKATANDGWTTIHAAASNGHVATIERLVELEVDPKATKKNGCTTIYAAALNGHVAAIDRLVDLGVDPEATRNDCWTTIHAAASNGHVAAIEQLVALGVDPKATKKNGRTTIHSAASNGCAAAIERLVELGVDPKATTNDGWTTIHTAASNGHVAAIELLVELDVDPKATKKNGCTTIYAAALNGHVATIERLVALGVDPKATTNDGWTAAHAAALNGHVATVKRLVELGVDPQATNNDGWTTIHTAAQNGQTAAAAFLLHLGVDPTARTEDGMTALQWAVERHHDEFAALLRHPHGWLVLADDMPAEFLSVNELPAIPASLKILVALGPMTDVRLDSVLRSSTCLQSLDMLAIRGLDSAGVHRLSIALAGCHKLRRLDLSSSTFDNTDGMESCVSLTSLSLADCVLSSATLDTIAALPHLRRLVLSGASFDSLDPLAAGCRELRFLDVGGCGLFKAPTFLVVLPKLKQLVVVDNPFVDELQEYAELLTDPAVAVDFLRTLALSSEGKTRDVPVVLVGHGRAGKSQVLHALLHERSWLGWLPDAVGGLPGVNMLPGMVDMLPGVVERVPVVTESTSMMESGIQLLQMSASRCDSFAKRSTDNFEARFFDTPGQMEFFASNMTVLAPLFSSCVVLCVARCVPHGVLPQGVSLVKEKVRIERQFRLWLAEVSRAVVGAHQSKTTIDQVVPLSSRASVALVVTHRDVLENARGQEVVAEVETWLQGLAEELRAEFEATLVVHGSASFVNATVASVRGGGVAPLREQLKSLVHSRFVHSPTLPEVLVDARAFIVSDEVRQRRIIERPALENVVLGKFAERGLTLPLMQRLLEVLETNGSVLRTPSRRLAVVDPSWISRVMSSLYVDPKKHDAEYEMDVEASEFDALAASDEGGEVLASALLAHLRQFVDGDDALLERLLLVLVSNGIVIPLRLRALEAGKQQTESYMIVGRWMTSEGEDDSGGVRWSSGRESEASWFELVTGSAWSGEAASRLLALAPEARLREQPPFRLVSLRCSSGARMGPSFRTWLMYEVSSRLATRKYSFTVRRSGFACVLPFTRFQAAVHVQLPASGREFDVTLLAKRGDAAAALSFVLLEVVFPVLEKLSLQSDVQLRVVQRCSGCVGTREHLESDELHDQELASSGEVVATVESVQALCGEVCEGANYRPDSCRGCQGVLSRIQREGDSEAAAAPRHDLSSSFVPTIDRALIKLDKKPRVLGSGQFGSVMEGLYNGACVVLKELNVTSGEALAAFKEEAELLGRTSRHPCISLLLGLCELDDGRVYMVMERAGVCDLEKALYEPAVRPLLCKDWSEFGVLLGLLADVASALQHMHSQDPPIVHNDVALRNVLVRHENGQNRAKLTDMGLARAVPRGSVKQLKPGTPVPKWQMAPETLASREVSPASDVFQFGNLVYEVLARQRPFWSEWKPSTSDRKELEAARAAVVEDIKQGRRPSWEAVKAVGAFCPTWLRELADKCCSPDPADRPTMARVGEQLTGRVQEMQGVPRKQTPLGVYDLVNDEEVWKAGYAQAGSEESESAEQAEAAPAADDNDDDEDDEAKQAEVDDGDEPAPSPEPAPAWSVDDVCAWLLQLGIPACVELVPLFRHHGVDGALLMELDQDMLAELDVPRLTARALLKARDALHS